ncbi:probable CCR4-associated factor 1 homolog 11 [Argentina anserina]|uniref:probable CCR4-associated factor 1 homolog 11 n=1 Tax=Argentina anserina TaxID=57926 RepID=UPI0021764E60|nr:probable CCR4-associated factor 1 homolog 11 [Potentilla anserina]
MQAIDEMQCLHFPLLPPVPLVWKSNLKYEFDRIKKLIEQPQQAEGRLGCWSASIDTEFPGTIYKSDKGRLNDPEYSYEMMKKNVNATKIIQLGLTLADVRKNTYTWEFNFNDFDIDRDLEDKD